MAPETQVPGITGNEGIEWRSHGMRKPGTQVPGIARNESIEWRSHGMRKPGTRVPGIARNESIEWRSHGMRKPGTQVPGIARNEGASRNATTCAVDIALRYSFECGRDERMPSLCDWGDVGRSAWTWDLRPRLLHAVALRLQAMRSAFYRVPNRPF